MKIGHRTISEFATARFGLPAAKFVDAVAIRVRARSMRRAPRALALHCGICSGLVFALSRLQPSPLVWVASSLARGPRSAAAVSATALELCFGN